MSGSAISDVFYAPSDEIKAATADWVPVVTMDAGGGYDWTEFHAWYSPSARRYFWHGSAGCSCNSFSDDIYSVSDFEDGDKPALMAALRRFAEEYNYCFRATDLVDALYEANAFNPKAIVS